MGTRHLILVKKSDKLFGQYGQWDGYPEGAGVEVLEFVANKLDEKTFNEHFENATFLTDEEIESRWNKAGATGPFVRLDIANKFKAEYPHLSRDCGAQILDYIQDTQDPEIHDSHEFAADSLFCEWAYMLDLDKREMVVFKGFNKRPLAKTAFFKHLEPRRDGEYHPIREVAVFMFDQIKTLSKEEFLNVFKESEE